MKGGKLNNREKLERAYAKLRTNNFALQDLLMKYMRYVHETGSVNVETDPDYFQDNEYKILKAFQDEVVKEEEEAS